MATKIFCSYSHVDEELCRKLVQHLAPLQRQGLVECWTDRRIVGGEDWNKAIHAALETSDIVLLLISSDFLSSEYCIGMEVKRALELQSIGRSHVVPIILREVDWENGPFANLSALPTDGKAVVSAHWHTPDQALAVVARSLRNLVGRLTRARDETATPGTVRTHAAEKTNLAKYCRRITASFGRDDELRQISQFLQPGYSCTATIFGMGGVGKSRLAAEFAYQALSDASLVWWLPSDDPTQLLLEYSSMAACLSLPLQRIADLEIAARLVKEALQNTTEWLLVFDNVEKFNNIEYLLPSRGGHVLITSRDPAIGYRGYCLELKTWSRAKAARFLAKRSRQQFGVAARILAEELGGLPLACEQAAAYMLATGTPISQYVDLYIERRQELWGEEAKFRAELGDPVTVATVWQLSLRKIADSNPVAIQLLKLLSYLAPEPIPLRLLSEFGGSLEGEIGKVARDVIALNGAIGALRRYSLIDSFDLAVRVHRLVQAVTRDVMVEEERATWIRRALEAVGPAFHFDPDDPSLWIAAREILPHAVAVAAWQVDLRASALPAQQGAIGPRVPSGETQRYNTLGRLLRELGRYFRHAAQFDAARNVLSRALTIEGNIGTNFERQAETAIELGEVLREQGDLEGARHAQQYAVDLCTDNQVFESRQISAALMNLGEVLRAEGNPVGALGHLRKALAIANRGFGRSEEDLATILVHYGEALADQGSFKEAREAVERGIAIDRGLFGTAHPKMGRDYVALARVLLLANKVAAAQQAIGHAVTILAECHPNGHPLHAESLVDQARIFAEDEKLPTARLSYLAALQQYERFYDVDNLRTARLRLELAMLEDEMGDAASSAMRAREVKAAFAKAGSVPKSDAQRLERLCVKLGSLST